MVQLGYGPPVDEIIDAISTRRYEWSRIPPTRLKGGAASVGATQLAQFARRIEKATHEFVCG